MDYLRRGEVAREMRFTGHLGALSTNVQGRQT